MGLTETIVFYLLFGIGIATAVALARDASRGAERYFRIASAVFFWPLYLPILLDHSTPDATVPHPLGDRATASRDPFEAAIAQVEAELEAALDSLDGWAENVLAPEQDRFAELRAAWRLQAERIRQLDRLLESASAPRRESAVEPTPASVLENSARYRQSEQARRENFQQLQTVRHRMHEDLLGTLAWVRELVSMIHLAKYTGAPASRAEELVSQIATAVEGLSEVTQWREAAGVGR